MCEELGSIRPDDWSVSYATIRVVTGRMALGRAALRLHAAAQEVGDWGMRKMEEIERKVASLAALEASKGQAADPEGNDLERPDDLVISIDLTRKLRSGPGAPGGAAVWLPKIRSR